MLESKHHASDYIIQALSKALYLPLYDHQHLVDGRIVCYIKICSQSPSQNNGICDGEHISHNLQNTVQSESNGVFSSISTLVSQYTFAKAYYVKAEASSAVEHYRALIGLTSHIAIATEERGGLLLHSALVVKDNRGFLLLGPSGTGKTTASLRVQPPWKSMSDDLAMAIKGHDGIYRAHPWPTWFHLLGDYDFTSWEIEKAFVIQGLYFVYQSETDQVTPVGPAEATAHLLEAAHQVGYYPHRTRTREEELHLLDYLSDLARSVPSYRLDISLDGEFWKLLE